MSKPVLVEVSARHVHVSREDLDILFGKGHALTKKKDLSQPGQFACEERVTVVGPKKEIKGLTILGPERCTTQIELSMTDARSVGIAAPIRESGNLEGSPGCRLVGPKGEIELKQGVIVAKRHIHMTSADAQKYGLKDKQIVSVKIDGDVRPMIFDEVVVRVNDQFGMSMHVDTDEGNAACIVPGTIGEILA